MINAVPSLFCQGTGWGVRSALSPHSVRMLERWSAVQVSAACEVDVGRVQKLDGFWQVRGSAPSVCLDTLER
jgi:hypothetical protein